MDKLVYLVYPLTALLLLWGAKWSGRTAWNGEFLSLEQCKHWQGFFAVCIMLHHASQKTCAPWLNKRWIIPGLEPFVLSGFWFVAFFLVCSGYGLYKSVKAKPDYLNGFVRRRVLPMVAAYYVTGWIFLAVRLFMGQKISALHMILYITGVGHANPNAWYVMVVPLFYLAFYVSFRMFRREGAALASTTALVLLWVLIGCATDHNDWYICGEWWYNTAAFFPLGLFLAKYEKGFVRAAKRAYLPLLALSIAAIWGLHVYSQFAQDYFGYYCEWNPHLHERIFRRLMCVIAQVGVAGAFVLFILLVMMKLRIGNRALRFMGGITLEFYLIHGLYVELFGFDFMKILPSVYYIRNVALYVLVIAVLSVPSALAVRWMLNPAHRRHPA